MRRNETQPIAFAPKMQPPATSWWTTRIDRDAWYQTAEEEAQRMNGSKEAKRVSSMNIINV